jgi:hypothetical protein
MLMQHSDGGDGTIGLLPAWPCGRWSVNFKLHAPNLTTIEGKYNHTVQSLTLDVTPKARQMDVKVMNCNKKVTFV